MTRLTRVELRRMTARRMIQLALLAMVVIVGLGLFGLHQQVSNLDSERAMAEQAYEESLREWERSGEQMVEDCRTEQDLERERSGDPTVDFGCDQMRAPQLEDFLGGPQSLFQAYEDFLHSLSYPVLFLAFAVGTTATAAEFAHRTMGTWLTFEPRRDRVFGSKVLAGALGTLPLGLGFVALVLLGTAAVFRLNGVDDAVTGEEWGVLAWVAVRVVALTAVAGLAGAAGGMLLRHTGAVLGVVIGYFVAFEGVLSGLFPSLSRWTLSLNLDAWIRGGAQRSVYDCPPTGGECVETVYEVSQGAAGLFLAAVVLAVVVAGWARFRRGDVD
jgi:ABC-2 type transport system permease protein